MPKSRMTRRRFLATTAASTAVIAMPHVSRAQAGGKLTMGFWDHWVPGANNASKALVNEWGAKNKVEVSIDYITSQGNKNLLTIAAEAQARSGHDIFAFPTWEPQAMPTGLEPVDDIMAELIKQNGAVNQTVEYLGHNGRWVAVPACVGSQIKGPCSRIDLMKKHAGIDVVGDVSGRRPAEGRTAWTLDAMLKAAEACHKGGYPFGIGLGTTEDNVDTAGAIFQSFGANLVDAKGNISVKSDAGAQGAGILQEARAIPAARRAGLGQRLQQQVPDRRQGRADHEPAERLGGAKRDAPQVAEQCWTHGMPSGPAGPFAPFLPYFWGIWKFGKNKSAAKSLWHICRTRVGGREDGRGERGYDLPAFEKLTTFKTWAEEGPPKGTLYHYPNPHNHQILSIAARPRRRRSPSRSTPRRSRPRWWCGSSRASRWKRRWPGPKASSKASCAPEGARTALPQPRRVGPACRPYRALRRPGKGRALRGPINAGKEHAWPTRIGTPARMARGRSGFARRCSANRPLRS